METIEFLNYATLNISKEDISKLKDALDVLDKYTALFLINSIYS